MCRPSRVRKCSNSLTPSNGHTTPRDSCRLEIDCFLRMQGVLEICLGCELPLMLTILDYTYELQLLVLSAEELARRWIGGKARAKRRLQVPFPLDASAKLGRGDCRLG